MSSSRQSEIDMRIQAYYTQSFDEHSRLTTRSAQGPLEFRRTQEIIRAHVPGGRVLDVGGGAGVHASALRDAGYDVVLIDPVPRHVEQALETGLEAYVGDARELRFPDGSFDAVLLLGPLYHLSSHEDRRQALREARRVTRAKGRVLAAALSRYIAFGKVSLAREAPSELPAEWSALITHGTPVAGTRFPAGHYHSAEELQSELEAADLTTVEVVGVEGPAGLFLEGIRDAHAEMQDAAHALARAAQSTPGIRDFSAHLIGIGTA